MGCLLFHSIIFTKTEKGILLNLSPFGDVPCSLFNYQIQKFQLRKKTCFNKELQVQTSAVGLSTFLGPIVVLFWQPLVLLQPVHASVTAPPIDLALGACPDCQRASGESDASHALGRQRCSTRALRGSWSAMTCRSSSGGWLRYILYRFILLQLDIVAFTLTEVVAGAYRDYRPVFVLHRTGELSEVIRSAILKAGYSNVLWHLVLN